MSVPNFVPNFLIIGAARSGSTYLARNLATHPNVFIPVEKELHFFDRHYNKGWAYYKNFFEEAASTHKVIGEATPTYMTTVEWADRIHEHLPDTKLIAILRDPVDRAYSHYWNVVAGYEDTEGMTYAEKVEAHPFEETLETHDRLIEDGLYAQNLRPFLDRFGRDQLLVLIYEEVTQNPAPHLARAFQFLGVDDSFRSPLLDRRINSTSQKHGRSSLLLRMYNFFTAYINLPSLAGLIEETNEVEYPPMDSETRSQLEKRFEEPNRDLEQLLDRSIDAWRSPKSHV